MSLRVSYLEIFQDTFMTSIPGLRPHWLPPWCSHKLEDKLLCPRSILARGKAQNLSVINLRAT